MKYILLVIIFSCFAINAFAQKDEKLRFLITDSEQTDSAYLKTIIQRIYFGALNFEIEAYYNSTLQNVIDTSFVKKIGEFCETIRIQKGESCWFLEDTTICSEIDPNLIVQFSLNYQRLNAFPQSMAIELNSDNNESIKYSNFWVNFNDLFKILTQKQISTLLESTKYLF